MTYPEAIESLLDLTLFGSKLGLDNPRRLAELADSPHERLRFIHVAGTNGKGSVCAMLESIYREVGLRTGLFTSPHLVSFRERMQVNRELIPEETLARLTAQLRDKTADFHEGRKPTFFELTTVMALCHFAQQSSDIVLWETGMGGRLDATNIVNPLASVITNVGLDHTRWLGDTRAAIAAEKAGIDGIGEALEGPTGFVYTENDPVAPAKLLSDFSKEAEGNGHDRYDSKEHRGSGRARTSGARRRTRGGRGRGH